VSLGKSAAVALDCPSMKVATIWLPVELPSTECAIAAPSHRPGARRRRAASSLAGDVSLPVIHAQGRWQNVWAIIDAETLKLAQVTTEVGMSCGGGVSVDRPL